MGFFSEILSFAAPIVGSFLGVPQAPAAVAAPAPAPALLAAPTQLARISEPPAPMQLLAKGRKGGPIITPQQAQELFGASGRIRKRTTVESFDPATGVVLRTETFPGGVAVRASDVAAAKRVFRQVTKLGKRLPKKLVKESQLKQLTDRVVKNALERAGDQPDCPK